MSSDGEKPPRSTAELVPGLVQSFVTRRVEAKVGFRWLDARGNPERTRQFNDAKEDVARKAFLAVRGRTGADFVDYFASTICSVPQFLRLEEQALLSQELRRPEERDAIRTLTMLALSAASWSPAKKED